VLLLKFQQAADGEFSYPKLTAQILNTGESDAARCSTVIAHRKSGPKQNVAIASSKIQKPTVHPKVQHNKVSQNASSAASCADNSN